MAALKVKEYLDHVVDRIIVAAKVSKTQLMVMKSGGAMCIEMRSFDPRRYTVIDDVDDSEEWMVNWAANINKYHCVGIDAFFKQAFRKQDTVETH